VSELSTLREVLKTVVLHLGKLNVPYCLVGGLALGVHAKPRATDDVDLLITCDEKNLDRVKKYFQEVFEKEWVSGSILELRKMRIFRVVLDNDKNLDGTILIDFLLAEHDVWREAVEASLEFNLDDVAVRVIKPEDLVLLKTVSGRTQDLADIEAIEASLGGQLDREYMKSREKRLELQ